MTVNGDISDFRIINSDFDNREYLGKSYSVEGETENRLDKF